MTEKDIVTFVTSILGMVFGLAGLTLGIMNYLRDRPRVAIVVNWDVRMMPNQHQMPKGDHRKTFVLVHVANLGRRPIFIARVGFKFPKGAPSAWALIPESLGGKKLAEGDPPHAYFVDQADFSQHAKYWTKIQVVALDSAGKEYAQKLDPRSPPNWVTGIDKWGDGEKSSQADHLGGA